MGPPPSCPQPHPAYLLSRTCGWRQTSWQAAHTFACVCVCVGVFLKRLAAVFASVPFSPQSSARCTLGCYFGLGIIGNYYTLFGGRQCSLGLFELGGGG